MAKDDLKYLHPEEKIRKLKELQEKKEKEIVEAKKQIEESEGELKERRKWVEKVPIPQVAKEDLAGLSEEAREILKVQKGLVEAALTEEETKEEDTSVDREESGLEEAISQEQVRSSPEARQMQYGILNELQLREFDPAYVAELSREPMWRIEEDIQSLYKNVQEAGYITPDQQQFLSNRMAATEEKFRAYKEGAYPTMSQEIAERGSLTLQLGSRMLHRAYRASTPREKSPQEMYKSG